MNRVCNPVLETDAIKYSVQPGCAFLDPRYFAGSRHAHSGIDLNDVRGADTDLGNRVRACADGIVVAAGDYPDWGGIVLIHHPDLSVWTQYAHVTGIPVQVGQRVNMGEVIGHIGKGANNQYAAHLHFEVRRSELPANFWASNRFYANGRSNAKVRELATAYIREHYLDPEKWLEEHQAIRTLSALEGHLKVQAAPIITPAGPQAVPAGPRVVLSRYGQPFEDISGARVEIKDAGSVVINATDPQKIQVRVN